MTEADIQSAILRYLATREDGRWWRNNAGAALNAGGRLVRYGVPGQADVTGVLAGGRRCEIECKVPGGRLTAAQSNYRAMVDRFGGLYVLATSVDDVRRALDEAAAAARRTA